jgi:hypothetical protein
MRRKHKAMPTPVRQISGCKVGFYYYSDEATARRAAKIARYNGAIDAERGYDFGYRMPGELNETPEGLWQVVIP